MRGNRSITERRRGRPDLGREGERASMTLYMVQRCLFDHLRRLEAAGDGPKPDIVTEGYNLTPEERRAVTEPDIGAIYAMGAHPVIINGFCRALGYKRADYRPLLENSGAVPTPRRTPWQKS